MKNLLGFGICSVQMLCTENTGDNMDESCADIDGFSKPGKTIADGFKMGNKKEDLVGTIIEINDTKYLIDRVFEVEKEFNSERAIEQPRLSITLIEIKLEKKLIRPSYPKVESLFKMNGFCLSFNKELIDREKLQFIKALKATFQCNVFEAKQMADSCNLSKDRYICYFAVTHQTKEDATNHQQRIHTLLCNNLYCNSEDVIVSIY